ncbi:hypothetical protein [Halomonas sp. CSM-2]|uniref:hypothetical protein n=1 Tax=Halomonas sp. CSM-2 TaxID=1975722 RepID=UPI000A287DAE|nr:hypothetical protein [Halomonas sp. CSM-2]
MSFLKLVPGKVWMAVLALGLTIVGWFINEHRIDTLQAERDSALDGLQRANELVTEWRGVSEQLGTNLNNARRERAEAEEAVKALQAELIEQAADYQPIRQRIEDAPDTDDGPVAPVLRDTLERLP